MIREVFVKAPDRREVIQLYRMFLFASVARKLNEKIFLFWFFLLYFSFLEQYLMIHYS